MEKDLLGNIENRMKTLSKGQKKIAEFIVNHYDKAVALTAARLGETVGVSESTVVRFAVELGYGGYPEMQNALVEVVKTRLTATQRMDVSSGRIEKMEKSVLDFSLRHDADKIMATMATVDQEAFDKTVDYIIHARKVYIVAGRSSAALAMFFHFYLKIMHDNVVLVDTGSVNEIYEHLINICDKDVCIAISFPRYTKRTVKALQYASAQNATTVAITDNYDSPIAEFGNYTLCAKTDSISFVDSLVAPLSLMSAILSAISLKRKESLYSTFEKLEKLWRENEVY